MDADATDGPAQGSAAPPAATDTDSDVHAGTQPEQWPRPESRAGQASRADGAPQTDFGAEVADVDPTPDSALPEGAGPAGCSVPPPPESSAEQSALCGDEETDAVSLLRSQLGAAENSDHAEQAVPAEPSDAAVAVAQDESQSHDAISEQVIADDGAPVDEALVASTLLDEGGAQAPDTT